MILRCLSAALLAGAALLSTFGCGRSLPPATDPDKARAALETALEAWSQGRTPESLGDNDPAIDFRDVSWEKGARLKDFAVEKSEKSGLSARFTVRLDLTEPGGRQRTRRVVYSADAGPAIVIRPEF